MIEPFTFLDFFPSFRFSLLNCSDENSNCNSVDIARLQHHGIAQYAFGMYSMAPVCMFLTSILAGFRSGYVVTSVIYLFICSFIHPFIHSLLHSFILFIHSFIYSVIRSFVY